MQRPIITQIIQGGQTYQVRAAYNGKFEIFILDADNRHAVHISMHDTMDQAVEAIKAHAKRRGIK